MSGFQTTSPNLFFSKNDPNDPRLGDLTKRVESHSLKDYSVALSQLPQPLEQVACLAGYPDDEGIRLNGGRTGAKEAPDTIRKYLYKMTPSFLTDGLRLFDVGNLNISRAIDARHETARAFARQTLEQGARWVALGGGHDYGFADAAAFIDDCRRRKERPLVINFDAHLDVRALTSGLTSGTPFFRMLEHERDLDFAEIGIQAHCNSRAHFEWAKSRGVRILSFEEIQASGQDFTTKVLEFLGEWALRRRPCFFSIDIDGFSSAFAMGCSQSWATGFEPNSFFRLFDVLRARLDVRALGLYEVSPPLDQDDRTSKLAAQIVHRFLYPL